MTAHGAGFVPEVELIAYQRGPTWLDGELLHVHHVRFYAARHRWPLLLCDGEITAALHLAAEPLPSDVDELAALAFRGVLRAGLDAVAALDNATNALTTRIDQGTATSRDRTLYFGWWGSLARHIECQDAAERLCANAPDQARTVPPTDGPTPWEVA